MTGLVAAVLVLSFLVGTLTLALVTVCRTSITQAYSQIANADAFHRMERDTLLRAVLAKHGGEFGTLDRIQKDAHVREIRAHEQPDSYVNSELGRHLAALVGDIDPADMPPLVPEGM